MWLTWVCAALGSSLSWIWKEHRGLIYDSNTFFMKWANTTWGQVHYFFSSQSTIYATLHSSTCSRVCYATLKQYHQARSAAGRTAVVLALPTGPTQPADASQPIHMSDSPAEAEPNNNSLKSSSSWQRQTSVRPISFNDLTHSMYVWTIKVLPLLQLQVNI